MYQNDYIVCDTCYYCYHYVGKVILDGSTENGVEMHLKSLFLKVFDWKFADFRLISDKIVVSGVSYTEE